MSKMTCKGCLSYNTGEGECWITGNAVDENTPACIDHRRK